MFSKIIWTVVFWTKHYLETKFELSYASDKLTSIFGAYPHSHVISCHIACRQDRSRTREVHVFSRHSPRVLSLREAEFFQSIQGIGARLLENPKFISWARIRARLGKSQVQDPITCPLVDGLMICNWVIYIRVL
jgi:hypothetical protein